MITIQDKTLADIADTHKAAVKEARNQYTKAVAAADESYNQTVAELPTKYSVNINSHKGAFQVTDHLGNSVALGALNKDGSFTLELDPKSPVVDTSLLEKTITQVLEEHRATQQQVDTNQFFDDLKIEIDKLQTRATA